MNMASHDFYSNRCLEVEEELMDMFDELDAEKEELNEELGKNIIDKGNSYLNLSTKFMQELDRMEQFAPNLQEIMFGDGADEEIFKFYLYNLKGVRESQMTVHNQLQIKLNLIQKLIDGNGYGSYD